MIVYHLPLLIILKVVIQSRTRIRLQSVVIDLNAQYQSFIYRLFPLMPIAIIDRFPT